MKEKELIKKLDTIKEEASKQGIDISDDVENLEKKIYAVKMTEDYEVEENPWERVQLSRKIERPKGQNFIERLIDGFIEFHGDRGFRDDKAIIGGIGYFKGIPVTVIATRKGKNLKENQLYNFGMPQPEGYRKALRLVKQAEKFGRPVLFFVDTPGAFPGIDAEEHGIAEAVARNLFEFSHVKTPMITTITGEGGSGGALALSVSDKIYMMENAIFSVISPEGCASILFKDASKAPLAAQSLKLTASELKKLEIIDAIIPEGEGLHVLPELGFRNLQDKIYEDLMVLMKIEKNILVQKRYEKYRKIGFWEEIKSDQKAKKANFLKRLFRLK